MPYLRGTGKHYETVTIHPRNGCRPLPHDPQHCRPFSKSLPGVTNAYSVAGSLRGSMGDSPPKRVLLSRTGTVLSNLLLGTTSTRYDLRLSGFHRRIVERFCEKPLTCHAGILPPNCVTRPSIQGVEVPIRYKAPSPRSGGSIRNSLETLLHFWWRRLTFRAQSL